MSLLIKNGRILDPANNIDAVGDLRIIDDKIAEVRLKSSPGDAGLPDDGCEVIDASGRIVTPGFVDLHVHLREPGREDKETIASGTRAAAAGGYTSICPMPNTEPVCDSAQGLQFLTSRARDNAVVNVFPIAAVTIGQKGESITEYGDLVYYGAVAFSDDGHTIMNPEIMRRALEYTSMFNVPILAHCEDNNLAENGQMRDGVSALRLGLKGIPAAAESSIVARDVDLASYTGGRVHICHVSVASSLEFIENAKKRGVKVSCEVTPHHLTLTDECMGTYDTNFKMSPPLGCEEERRALIEGLKSGVIDCICTDHAPHTDMEKDRVMSEAPFGVIGLESAFPVLYTDLVMKGDLELGLLVQKMTTAPAKVLGLNKGTLSIGADADVTVLDLEKEFTLDVQKFYSRSKNCPWDGKQVHGLVKTTIVKGRVIYHDGRICV